MSPEVFDPPDLTPEQLLSDLAYVRQWGMHFHRAAEAVAAQTFNLGDVEFQAAQAFIAAEVERRRAKYPNYNRVATGRGLIGAGTDVWTQVDFPGEDAILGPHPKSVESQLRMRYPTVYSALAPFVPPSQPEGV